jgi:catechol 2,3-dioxygenase-like lactoylglutathione lyase family enzyme
MTDRAGHIVAVGHVGLNVQDLESLTTFYRETLGLRESVHIPGTISIFEVGTTDLFLMPGLRAPVEFDLATDDVVALHARLDAAGVSCTELTENQQSGHRGFELTDPEGNAIHVVNAHPRHGS